MMARLLMLIGLPGSGKSTLATRLAAQEGWQVVSTDCIRGQLFGDEAIQGSWFQIWAEVERQLRAIAPLPNGKVIYDATNTRRRQRRQFISLARSWGFERVEAFWVDVPLEVCLVRNRARDRQVPVPVICTMHRQLQGAPPSLQEGFDRLVCYHVSAPDNSTG